MNDKYNTVLKKNTVFLMEDGKTDEIISISFNDKRNAKICNELLESFCKDINNIVNENNNLKERLSYSNALINLLEDCKSLDMESILLSFFSDEHELDYELDKCIKQEWDKL